MKNVRIYEILVWKLETSRRVLSEHTEVFGPLIIRLMIPFVRQIQEISDERKRLWTRGIRNLFFLTSSSYRNTEYYDSGESQGKHR